MTETGKLLSTEPHVEFLWHVHTYTDANIRSADAKATLVIAWSSVLMAYLMSGKAHHLLQPDSTTPASILASAHSLLALAAFGFLAGAFVLAVMSITLKLRDESSPGFIFWRRIRAHRTAARFREQLLQRTRSDLASHLAGNVFLLAGVCQRKYRRLMWAIRAAFLGTVAGGVMMFVTP